MPNRVVPCPTANLGQWLPGDDRGFRSRHHKVHSSGDYRHRPPRGKHACLERHARKSLNQPPVRLGVGQRGLVGELILHWCRSKAIRLAAVAVASAHSHLFVELPVNGPAATVGKLKRYCSTEATRRDTALPSTLFARGGDPVEVRSAAHAVALLPYVVEKHARQGAWVWSDEQTFRVACSELRGF
jgi:hypothetical protein